MARMTGSRFSDPSGSGSVSDGDEQGDEAEVVRGAWYVVASAARGAYGAPEQPRTTHHARSS